MANAKSAKSYFSFEKLSNIKINKKQPRMSGAVFFT